MFEADGKTTVTSTPTAWPEPGEPRDLSLRSSG
jgi:hypothetical protein